MYLNHLIGRLNDALEAIRSINFKGLDLSLYGVSDERFKIGYDSEALLNSVVENPSGFTKSIFRVFPCNKGYAVGVNGLTLTFDGNEADFYAWLDVVHWLFTHSDIGQYIHIGGWRAPDEKYEIDVVVVFRDEQEAIKFAKEQDQIAVYNLETDEEIETGGTGGKHLFKE